jgi:RimJ/RimL family protein N-acetyltransferase
LTAAGLRGKLRAVLPDPTPRLRFREMTHDDLDDLAALLGDPEIMTYYPAPKTRDEALGWINWNITNYATYGHGLWIIETHDGEFVGDCGLTVQRPEGEPEIEVGYHVRTRFQRQGLATEAATACREVARAAGVRHLIAIIHPANLGSQGVARRIGLREERRVTMQARPVVIFGADL